MFRHEVFIAGTQVGGLCMSFTQGKTETVVFCCHVVWSKNKSRND